MVTFINPAVALGMGAAMFISVAKRRSELLSTATFATSAVAIAAHTRMPEGRTANDLTSIHRCEAADLPRRRMALVASCAIAASALIGGAAHANPDDVHFGPGSTNDGVASGGQAIAISASGIFQATAAGGFSVAIGNGASSPGGGSLAIGAGSAAGGPQVVNSVTLDAINAATAIGENAVATSEGSTAVGGTNNAKGANALAAGASAFGTSSLASGINSTALGAGAHAISASSVA